MLKKIVQLSEKILFSVETIQSNAELFVEHGLSAPPSAHSHDHPPLERRQSNMSIASQISGVGELTVSSITASKYTLFP